MIAPAVFFSALIAGISLTVLVMALLVRGSTELRRLSVPFAALSAVMVLFAIAQTMRSSCNDLGQADVIARIAFAMVALLGPSVLWVYRRILQVTTVPIFDCTVGALLLGLAIYSLLSPGGIGFVAVTAITVPDIGWWGPVSVLSGPPDPMVMPFFVLLMAVLLRICFLTITRRGRLSRALFCCLMAPVVFMVGALVHGYAIIHGWWEGIPIAEYTVAGNYVALCWAVVVRGIQIQREVGRYRRQSEAILEHGIGLAGLVDCEGRLILANRVALELVGLQAGDVIGKPFVETPWWTHDPAAQARLAEAIDRARQGEGDRFITTHALPDGSIIDIDFTLTPYRSAAGQVEFLIAVGRDITDLRRMDRMMQESSKMQAVGQLASGVAHDFNNVLCGIIGGAELALLQTDDPAIQERLEMILDAAGNAGDLTKRLLAFARKGKVETTVVHLHAVVSAAVELFRSSAGPTFVLEQRLAADPDTIVGDPAELQSAILNVLVNARDAMPDGGLITLSTARLTVDEPQADVVGHVLQPGSYVSLSIQDQGTGIDAATRERIFEPFFTTKPSGQGTGLGLPAVVGTCHSHAGGLLLTSVIDEGSTFTLVFAAEAGIKRDTVRISQPRFTAGGELVVLVDDDARVREQASELLGELGFRVEAFADPLAAQRRFEDLAGIRWVLLDLAMPGLNGGELYRQLREQAPGLPIIITSGYAGGGQLPVMDGDTRVAFLQKPWRLAQLQSVLVRVGAIDEPAAPR